MYMAKKVLCVIPARSGSKGLPGKNIKELMGKPLLAYSIEHAKASKYIDRIVVSTDGLEIAGVALRHGAEVPFLRPNELAGDQSSTIDALLHAVEEVEGSGYGFDYLVLLHVTTPLRSAEDVDACIELLAGTNAESVFSVTEAHRNPYFNMVEVSDGRVSLVKPGNFVSRQTAPRVFDMNSSIYVWKKDALKEKKAVILDKTAIYMMPRERSIDIDDGLDFRIAEMILKEGAEVA